MPGAKGVKPRVNYSPVSVRYARLLRQASPHGVGSLLQLGITPSMESLQPQQAPDTLRPRLSLTFQPAQFSLQLGSRPDFMDGSARGVLSRTILIPREGSAAAVAKGSDPTGLKTMSGCVSEASAIPNCDEYKYCVRRQRCAPWRSRTMPTANRLRLPRAPVVGRRSYARLGRATSALFE